MNDKAQEMDKPIGDSPVAGPDKTIPVKSSPVIHLKDKAGRNVVGIDFGYHFGFMPERILIEKMPGQNNRIRVHAVLPAEKKEKNAGKEGDKKDN